MVSKNNLSFGLACSNRYLDKVHTSLMSTIEVSCSQAFFTKQNAMKIGYVLLCIICIGQVNMRP